MSDQFDCTPLYPDPWQGLDTLISAGYIAKINGPIILPSDIIITATQGDIIDIIIKDRRDSATAMREFFNELEKISDDSKGEPTQPLSEPERKPALDWLTKDCTACKYATITIYRSELGTYRIIEDDWANGHQLYCATDVDDLQRWFLSQLPAFDLNALIWAKENYL